MKNYKFLNNGIILNFVILLLFIFSIISIHYNKDFLVYFQNVVTVYIQDIDFPYLDQRENFFDLSLVFIIIGIFFYLLNYFKKYKIIFHLKNIFLIKLFFLFFIVTFYESNFGLDQTQYFDIIYNNKTFVWHYGNLEKFSLENSAFFFINFFKILFFLLPKTWFGLKFLLAIFYTLTTFLLFKLYETINEKENINFTILYIISFFPSFFIFSSFLTKDILIYPLIISSIIFLIKYFRANNINFLLYCFILIFFLFLLRWWIGFSLLLSSLVFIFLLKLEYLKKIQIKFILFILFVIGIFIYEIIINNNNLILNRAYAIANISSYLNISIADQNFSEIKNIFDYLLIYIPKQILFYFANFNFNKLSYLIINLENLLLILLLIPFIKNYFKYSKIKKKFFIFLLFFYLLISFFYILSNTHLSFGTTARYALQYKLLLLILLIDFVIIYLNNFLFQKLQTVKKKKK